MKLGQIEGFFPESGMRLPQFVRLVEITIIDSALKAEGGNKSAAARKLGILRTTLIEKMKRYGM